MIKIKTKYIYIIAILIIVIIILIINNIHKRSNKNIEISNIKHLSFSYSTGYHMNARVRYEIDYKDKEYTAVIIPNEIPEEDKLEVKIEEKDIKKIIAVLKKYHVSKWNGFDKVDKNVLDGNSFSFYLRMQDDNKMEASGYMKWPEDYGKVRSELDSIFMDIYDKNGGKKYE